MYDLVANETMLSGVNQGHQIISQVSHHTALEDFGCYTQKITSRRRSLRYPRVVFLSLSRIVNSSLETGVFPNRWKIAKISSIFRGNIATNRDKYRPISILPCLSKICESCVNNQMNEHGVEFQTFFEPRQYAYKKHSSTVTALIQVTDSLKLAVDQKQYSVATFIDLRKVFDVIDHHVLLERLKKYGFGETLM